LRSSENIWTPAVTYRNASIFRALDAVFGDVVVLPGATNIVLASRATLSRDPAVLGARLAERGVRTRLVTREYVSYLYTNDRFLRIAEALSASDVPANTDARPVCYKYSSMIWLSKFFPRLITAELETDGWSPQRTLAASAAGCALVAALLLVSRRHRGRQRITIAAFAGLVGMVLETELILHYQVRSGVLYQNLGILLMVFMAGLAAGAATAPRLARSGGLNSLRKTKLSAMGMFAGFAAVNLAFVGLLRAQAAGLAAVSLLMFSGGALVSGLFACASLLGEADQRTLVSPLYAADLLGGCAGSLAGSVFLVPFLGLEQTAWAMIVVSLAALLSVWLVRQNGP
jgi:hypothetical protein